MKAASILCLLTSNYDEMVKFLEDFGFEVTEDPYDQLVPLFGVRGAHVERGDLSFNLEESASREQKAAFNLFLTDYPRAEVDRLKALGYACETRSGLYGESHHFQTPDGGTFVL
jgi:hypothetical protein